MQRFRFLSPGVLIGTWLSASVGTLTLMWQAAQPGPQYHLMTVLWVAAALGTVSFALFLLLIGPVSLLPAWRATTAGFKKVMIAVALALTGTLGVVIWVYFLIALIIMSD